MNMILCRDINGKAHVVAKTSLIKRTSAYGVIRSKKGILLVRDRTSSDKKWDLPGGGIEPKERLLDGLKREIKEETGLDIIGRPTKICKFTEYFYDIDSGQGWESTRHFYEVSHKGDPIMDGNYEDIVDARYFKLPLPEGRVSAVAVMVTKMQNNTSQ